jgi:hypothetical protein
MRLYRHLPEVPKEKVGAFGAHDVAKWRGKVAIEESRHTEERIAEERSCERYKYL